MIMMEAWVATYSTRVAININVHKLVGHPISHNDKIFGNKAPSKKSRMSLLPKKSGNLGLCSRQHWNIETQICLRLKPYCAKDTGKLFRTRIKMLQEFQMLSKLFHKVLIHDMIAIEETYLSFLPIPIPSFKITSNSRVKINNWSLLR